MSGPGPIDFVPDAGEALALAYCVENRQLQVNDLDIEAVADANGVFQQDLSAASGLQAAINEHDTKIYLALAQAILRAGFGAPGQPPAQDVPDFSDCLQEVAAQANEAQQALGHLQSVFQVTYNNEGIPVRIQA